MAFLLFLYDFLAIIIAVTVLNIMNSISMSVAARVKQYGGNARCRDGSPLQTQSTNCNGISFYFEQNRDFLVLKDKHATLAEC